MNPNDAIDLQAIEWTSYVRFTYVENTIDNMPKVPRTKFLESDGLFSFISICKFGCFKNPFATITSLFEFYFRLRRFILLVQTKKWFIWTMAAAKEAENHGNEWGLTWYFQWGIYTSIPTWTHSQNSLAAAESPSLKISSHGRLLSKHFSLQPFFPKDWVSLPFVESVGHWEETFLKFGSPDHWKRHFQYTSWLQSTHCSSLINNIFPVNTMVWCWSTQNPITQIDA